MKKFLALCLVLLMALPLLMATASAEVTKLVTISLGTRPAGYDDVMAAVNEYAGEKYGINLEVRFLDWDPSKIYPIIMNTGDGVDLVFFSGWPGSPDWARKGAFVELDDILKDYPALYEAIPENYWEGVKINGHIYSVPAPEVSFSGNRGIVYRQDLCEKYNLPVPNSIENIEAYCEGILANEPGVEPLVTGFSKDMMYACLDTLVLPGGDVGGDLGVIVTENYGNINKYWGTQAHLDELKLARKWMEKGYISRDLQNDTIGAADKFQTGIGALMTDQHVDGYAGKLKAILDSVATNPERADWKVGYVPFNANLGKVWISSPASVNATGIAYVNQDHLKESMTFLQAVFTDPTLHHLLRYGVEGKHYVIDENGYYLNINGDYTACGLSLWNWRSDALNLEGANDAVNIAKANVIDSFKDCEQVFTTFSFDKTNVSDEVSNLKTVVDQYLTPLRFGLIEDVEAGLAKFMAEAEKAGLTKIQDEYIKQYKAWYETSIFAGK